VRGVVIPKRLAGGGGWLWGRGIGVRRNDDGGEVDVVGVLEFDVEVAFPAAVDGSVGYTLGAELGGQGHACAVKGELIVGVCDTVDGHDEDQECSGGRDARANCFLVIAKQEKRRDGDERK